MERFKIQSAEVAEEVSRKMWQIMDPGNSSTVYLFLWFTDSVGQVYIEIDPDMVCPVYVRENFNTVLQQVSALLNIEQAEGQQLRQYLESGEVVLGNLIPSTLEPYQPINSTWNP